jgi:hypothetical protein
MRKGENRSYLYCNWGERLNCVEHCAMRRSLPGAGISSKSKRHVLCNGETISYR